MKRFNIVFVRDDGAIEVHPMKEWLRQHPGELPADVHPSTTSSHKLRSILKRKGWRVEELASEVRLFPASASPASVEAVLGAEESEDQGEQESLAFALEAQLRDFIAHNLANIIVGGQSLKLAAVGEGKTAVEYSTDVGFIDILAQDSSGNYFVFELKLDRGPDRTLGQLARYMGWIKIHLARDKSVSGVIVARSMDDKLRYAASVIPNITLLEYEVSFTVHEARAPTPETA